MAAMQREPCRCVLCSLCGGSGNLWVTLDGKHHLHRVDDLGELETCEECRGTGVEKICDRCRMMEMEDEIP